MFLLILEREEGRERQREKYRCDRETSIGCLPYVPQPQVEPTAYVCALTGDQTYNLLVCGATLLTN